MGQELPVLGWKEQASLPAWGIGRLRAKLDTGARTSALHVEDFRVVDHHTQDGEKLPVVCFHVLVGRHDAPRRVEVTAPTLGFRMVRDTRATPERRPVLRTRVVCGPLDRMAEITLTDRTGMNFRLLLGRTALADGCLVDPACGYLATPAPPLRARAGRPVDG